LCCGIQRKANATRSRYTRNRSKPIVIRCSVRCRNDIVCGPCLGSIPTKYIEDMYVCIPILFCRELRTSREATICVATREIRNIIRNPKVYYRFSQEPSNGYYPEPDRSSPQHLICSPKSILILFTHLRHGLPIGLIPSIFPINYLYAFLFSPHSFYMPRQSYPP
jgi:hypothetical protein